MRCLITLVTLAAACGGSPPPQKPPVTPPSSGVHATLVVGGPGDGVTMATLTDGQDVSLVEGAQGGFHVWLEFRARDVAAGTLTLERSAHRVSDGAVVLRYDGPITIGDAGADGWWQAAEFPMFMCPTPIGISIVGEPIAYQLRLVDDGGAELARAGVTLVPRCPDAQLPFCTRICTG